MVGFFRVNDPYRLFFVLVVLVVVRTAYALWGLPLSWPEMKYLLLGEWLGQGFPMYSHTFDYTAPLSAWTYEWLDSWFGRSRAAHWVLSSALVFGQAMLFNRTLLNNKVFSEPNYVSAFLYVVFSVSTFDFFALSPQLMSLTFVIVSMDHLIRKMDNEAGDELFVFPGFYLGVAALFYFPSVAFFVVFLLALILITRATVRRLFLFVFGFGTAFAIVLTILYFQGALGHFMAVYFVEIARPKQFFITYPQLLVWISFPALFFLVAFFNALGRREGSLHAKTQQFMLLVLAASVGVLLVSGTLAGIDLLFFVPVFTFFLTNYILKIKRRIWRFVVPNLLIFSALLVPFIGVRLGVVAEKLLPNVEEGQNLRGKRIMVIGPLSPIYLQGTIVSPFIDEGIGRERIKDLDYYRQAPVFQDIFLKARPDVVVDEWQQLEKIRYRFPQVEEMDFEEINN